MFFLLPRAIGRQRKKVPFITYGLICFNVFVYFASVAGDFENTILSLGFRPDQNGWYTWLTSAFLHGDLMHLGSNMLFLYVFGSFLEDTLGKIKFISVYALGALASAFMFAAINILFIPQAISVPAIGASGAISALLGIALIRFRYNDLYVFYFFWILIFIKWGTFAVKTYIAVMIYFLIQIASGLLQIASGMSGGVGYWAHIGGFLFGVVSVYFLDLKTEAVMEEKEDKAVSRLNMGDAIAAASLSSELIENKPDNAGYYQLAGKANFEHGDDESACQNYCRAIELYLRENNTLQACLAYEEMLFYRPDITLPQKIQFPVSSACQGVGRFLMALEGFERFLKTYSDDPRAELALIRIGQLYEKMGELDQAVATFKNFLVKYPVSEWADFAKQWLRRHETELTVS